MSIPKPPYLRSLGEREIRLLVLQPGSYQDEHIECQLLIRDLENLPPYEALSHTWGEVVSHDIFVNGKRVKIRRNIYNALRCLRLRDADRILWIDTICVNLDDFEERAHQISLMRHL